MAWCSASAWLLPLPVHQAPATSKSPNLRRWRRRASTRSCAAKGDHYDRGSHGARRRLARARPGRVARPRRRFRAEGAVHLRGVRRPGATSASGRACGRSRRVRRSSRSPATTSSTRSATSRCSSCGPATARSARSTTRACTAAPASRRARARSRTGASSARTTGGSTPSTARSFEVVDRRGVHEPPRRPARCARCASNASAGSCSSTSTATPNRCSSSSIRCPTLLAPYHLERMRLRSLPHDDHRRELEGGRRRVQRGLPRAGPAPADPAVDRRREHRVRAARDATRTTAGCPGARRGCGRARGSVSRPTSTTRARSSPGSSRGSAARSSGTSARGRRAARVRAARRARRCSRRTRSAAGSCSQARGFDVVGLRRPIR